VSKIINLDKYTIDEAGSLMKNGEITSCLQHPVFPMPVKNTLTNEVKFEPMVNPCRTSCPLFNLALKKDENGETKGIAIRCTQALIFYPLDLDKT
jgi:hypothetical protein